MKKLGGAPQAQRQQLGAARRLFNKALRADSRHLPSIVGLSLLEARSGNITPALRLYRKGLSIDPNNVQLLHAAAQMHAKLNESQVTSRSVKAAHYASRRCAHLLMRLFC